MTLPTPNPRLGLGRLGSRKSNDGCITCKIRKVKCSEEKPVCRRCTTTGRKCDGYIRSANVQHGPPNTDNAILYMKHLPTYANFDQHEMQSFEFFMRRVVPGSSRTVDEHFWRQLVPQLSHSDPVIWDAAIALSSLIQHSQYTGKVTSQGGKLSLTEERRRALKWYNKSMARLRKHLSQATTRLATVLISCILYICIECLQDNLDGAVALYQRAVAMTSTMTERGRAICHITQSERSLEHTVLALLENMSASQRIPIKPTRILDQSNPTFQTLLEAREQLYVLLFASHDFVVDTRKIKSEQAKDWRPSSELLSRQQHLHINFLEWHSSFTDMIGSPGSVPSQDEVEPWSLLHVIYHHYLIMLLTSLSMYETDFDSFFSSFQAVVDHASRIIATTNRGDICPEFIFETRVVPSLFAVAIKCRHPTIRRQAISLLRNGAKIENTWRADTMADVAEAAIGVEESGSIYGVFSPEPRPIEFPPEESRVHYNLIVELQDSDGQPARFHQFQMWQQDESHAWSLVAHTVKI